MEGVAGDVEGQGGQGLLRLAVGTHQEAVTAGDGGTGGQGAWLQYGIKFSDLIKKNPCLETSRCCSIVHQRNTKMHTQQSGKEARVPLRNGVWE